MNNKCLLELFKKVTERFASKITDIENIISYGSNFENWTQCEIKAEVKKNEELRLMNIIFEKQLSKSTRKRCDIYFSNPEIWLEMKQIWWWENCGISKMLSPLTGDIQKHMNRRPNFFMLVEIIINQRPTCKTKQLKQKMLEYMRQEKMKTLCEPWFNNGDGKFEYGLYLFGPMHIRGEIYNEK
jgi:hypothetical protein